MDLLKVNAALRECLEECHASDDPIRCLSVFVLTLRADPGWEDAEVEHFEQAAREALHGKLDT